MAELKTRPNRESVQAFLGAIEPAQKREDARRCGQRHLSTRYRVASALWGEFLAC